MKVKIEKVAEDVIIPEYKTDGAAGMDLYAYIQEPIVLKPLERALVSTGIKIELPKGYEAQVRPRSGMALKNGLSVLNSPGTIDSDYRGVVGVIAINLSNQSYVIQPNERIAQMVIAKHEQPEIEVVMELSETERGEGGFGHTGI